VSAKTYTGVEPFLIAESGADALRCLHQGKELETVMKRMTVVSAALILIGGWMLWKDRRSRIGRRQHEVQLQAWEGEGGRAADRVATPASAASASDA